MLEQAAFPPALAAQWARLYTSMEALERRLQWDQASLAQLAAARPSIADSDVELALQLLAGTPTDLPTDTELATVAAEHAFGDYWLSRLRAVAPFAHLPGLQHLHRDLEQMLLACVAREAQQALLALYVNEPVVPGRYQAFVQRLLSAPALWIEPYPVLLARVLCLVRQARLNATKLARAIDQAATAGWVSGLPQAVAPLSHDPHRGGAVVLRLDYVDRPRVYKPRESRLELGFQRFIAKLNELGLDPPLPVLHGHAGDEFGLFDYVASDPRRAAEHLEPAHRQWGALIAVGYVLGGSDLHMENVLVAADGPLVVDAEGALKPTVVNLRGGAYASARVQLDDSVLGSGLVGFYVDLPGRPAEDQSALGGHVGERSVEIAAVVDLGTDAIRIGTVKRNLAQTANRLYTDSGPVVPSRYRSAVIAGCRQALALIAKAREQLFTDSELQGLFAAAQARRVLRPSRFYDDVLRLARSPQALRSGLHRAVALDSLNVYFARYSERPEQWPLVVDERVQLQAGDIPVFTVATNAIEQRASNGDLTQRFAASGVEAWRARLAALDEQQIEVQCELLLGAIEAEPEPVAGSSVAEVAAPAPFDAARLRNAALVLARRLGQRAVRGPKGDATWLAPLHLKPDPRLGRGAGHWRYDGALGIVEALFHAGRVASDAPLVGLASAGLKPLLDALADERALRWLAQEPIGAWHGIGSLVIGLLRLRDAGLVEPAEADPAVRVALTALGAERLAHADALDLELGVAGALLALDAASRNGFVVADGAIAAAVGCLERAALPLHHGVGFAPSAADAQPGLAHGNAGIALALARVARHNAAAAALAERAIAGLEDYWCPDRDGWQLRPTSLGWAAEAPILCNGLPGIVQVLAEIAPGHPRLPAALARLQALPLPPLDHLCCGALGSALVLAAVGDGASRAAAEQGCAQLHARASDGRYRLRVDATENLIFQPSLYRGVAGLSLGFLAMTGDAPNPITI